MTKSRIFLILSLSFIGGVFERSFFEMNNLVLYLLILPAIILFFTFYKNKMVMVVSFGIIFFVLGAWLASDRMAEAENQNLDGQEFSGKVMIAKDPVIQDKYQSVVVKTGNNLKILIDASPFSDLKYGDELDLKCALKIPENKDNSFDYRMYLAKDGIFYLCDKPSFEKTGENRGNVIYSAVLNFKNKLNGSINRVIPEPEGALAIGLIFGGTSGLSKEESNNFSKTGLSHIVAVSGFNVTIIAEYLMWAGIFIGLWRKNAFWFAVVGIFLFILMVGFPSSAIRAGVMGTLLLWAMKNGRLSNSENAIIFAAAVMLLLNPLLLRYDVGFQLSFLAALGIVEMSPFWEKYFLKRSKAFGALESVFLTLSATIFVMPVIIYNFHIASIVSVLANFLVLSVVPLSMLLVFLTAVAGLIHPLLSLPFAWITFLPLKYIIETVNYLADLKWSSAQVENFGAGWVVLWYLILFGVVYLIKFKMRKSKETFNVKLLISNVK